MGRLENHLVLAFLKTDVLPAYGVHLIGFLCTYFLSVQIEGGTAIAHETNDVGNIFLTVGVAL